MRVEPEDVCLLEDGVGNVLFAYVSHVNKLKILTCTSQYLYVTIAITCPPLECPPNGNITYSGDQLRANGSIATYTCQEGYKVEKGNTTRVCNVNSDGTTKWTGEPLECKRVGYCMSIKHCTLLCHISPMQYLQTVGPTSRTTATSDTTTTITVTSVGAVSTLIAGSTVGSFIFGIILGLLLGAILTYTCNLRSTCVRNSPPKDNSDTLYANKVCHKY